VRARVGAREGAALARVAGPEERSRLWPELCARNPALERVAGRVNRSIPLVVIEPGEWATSPA
jgi:hypothetical protein